MANENTIKVWPTNNTLRQVMKHPSGAGFRADGGPGDWPDDQFTQRRIADGGLVTEEPKSSKTSGKSAGDSSSESSGYQTRPEAAQAVRPELPAKK